MSGIAANMFAREHMKARYLPRSEPDRVMQSKCLHCVEKLTCGGCGNLSHSGNARRQIGINTKTVSATGYFTL